MTRQQFVESWRRATQRAHVTARPLQSFSFRSAAAVVIAGLAALVPSLAGAGVDGGVSNVSSIGVGRSPSTGERSVLRRAPDLHVSASGSDAGRCTRTAPCKTLNRAYNLARSGQVVQVRRGRYPGETISDQTGTKSGPNVVIQAEPGARVSFTSRLSVNNAGFLTLRNVTIEPFSDYWPLDMRCVRNLTLENVGGGRRFLLSKGENVLIKGGWWGNYGASGEQDIMLGGGGSSCSPAQPEGPSRNVALVGVTIRNVFWGVTWDTDESHPDCLQINDVDNLVIRNSRFIRCGQVFIGYYGDGNLRGALIENNLFAKIGSDAFFTSQFNDNGKPGRCGDIVFRNNTYDDSGGNSIKGYGFPYFSCRGGKVRVVNNIFHTTPRSDACGLNGSQWTNNVYELASVSHNQRFVCGRLARLAGAGGAGFVDREGIDYRLGEDSRARDAGSTKDYARLDIGGRRRYQGRAPTRGHTSMSAVDDRRNSGSFDLAPPAPRP